MANTYDEIFETALSLPPGFRAMLAEHLLKSLDSVDRAEIDALWAEEAEKRVQAVEQGNVNTIPGKEVFQNLRSRNK